ncbi:MAG: DUF2182 domain-containing protein [Gaiellaceae bacterium]
MRWQRRCSPGRISPFGQWWASPSTCCTSRTAPFVAGALTVAAGVYELTPLKRGCRRRWRESVRSGFEFGIYRVGSSIGLMVMLLALGIMSVTWMAVVAAFILAHKLSPPRAFIDAPLALTIIGLGISIVVAPSVVPGIEPAM